MAKKIMLLGSGELGKEFVIAAQRLGQTVVACDSYAGAPAMQVADACEVFPMLDGDALAAAVARHRPDVIVPEIEAIRTEEKVCHYLDVPIQHASDRILKRMGRRTNQAQLREIIGKLRAAVPDIALRTTMIAGFPGETQEDHEEVMRFVDEMEFERLGVFTYSAEEDTPAATFPDQIPEEVKEGRRDEIMGLQQEIAFEHCENMVGKVLDVMIEGKVADEPAYVGRTYMDAPNVDGLIFVNADEMLMSGDFVRVKVTGANEYDLIGEVYHESAE